LRTRGQLGLSFLRRAGRLLLRLRFRRNRFHLLLGIGYGLTNCCNADLRSDQKAGGKYGQLMTGLHEITSVLFNPGASVRRLCPETARPGASENHATVKLFQRYNGKRSEQDARRGTALLPADDRFRGHGRKALIERELLVRMAATVPMTLSLPDEWA
jgi:hypothetical protein